jgi:hypothetical protein
MESSFLLADSLRLKQRFKDPESEKSKSIQKMPAFKAKKSLDLLRDI